MGHMHASIVLIKVEQVPHTRGKRSGSICLSPLLSICLAHTHTEYNLIWLFSSPLPSALAAMGSQHGAWTIFKAVADGFAAVYRDSWGFNHPSCWRFSGQAARPLLQLLKNQQHAMSVGWSIKAAHHLSTMKWNKNMLTVSWWSAVKEVTEFQSHC